jgi:hypothetical protein
MGICEMGGMALAGESAGKIMSQRDKPLSHLKQRSRFRRRRNPSGWIGFIGR